VSSGSWRSAVITAGLLDGPRAGGAFLLRLTMSPPWSMRIQDEAPLAIVAIVRGHAWVVPDDRPAVRLGAGDVIVIRGPEPYRVADDPRPRPRSSSIPARSTPPRRGSAWTWP
jgi:hypothetical protein